MTKLNIANLITGTIILSLGIWLFVWGLSYSSQFGPSSETCKNLTNLGYFETDYEYVGHDSCIDGEYEWKEDCKFILPWWEEPTKCMYNYNHDDFNDTCNQARRDESLKIYKEYETFGMYCITHPINKIMWSWPIFLSFMFIAPALLVICNVIYEIFLKNKSPDFQNDAIS